MPHKPIKLIEDTIDDADIEALCKWLSQKPIPKLTKGQLTIEYERAYAKNCDREYAVFVSSGSNANLLALYALIATKRLKNKKVVVPSLAWATTVAPVIQFGLTAIMCDVSLSNNLAVDYYALEQIFEQEKPACLIMVTVLGIPGIINSIINLCDRYGVLLIMDNCESQNSADQFGTPIEKKGLMSTCSSYMGHITSTVEGGMIVTDDRDLYNTLKMIRSHGWTRDLDVHDKSYYHGLYNVPKFNDLYTFYLPGFNVRSTEINAFLGLRQLDKLPHYTRKRDENFYIYNALIENKFWKPSINYSITPHMIISNLGYPIIHPDRDKIAADLSRHQVENRPLISGPMNLQPFMLNYYNEHDLPRPSMPIAEMIGNHGMYVPNHPNLRPVDIHFISTIINKYTIHDNS